MKITQARIDELRATVPHADLGDLRLELKNDVEPDAEFLEDLRAYLHRFAAFPRGEDGKIILGNPCLGCGENLAGSLADQLLTSGGFTWGLAHGHGHCKKCGWPATLYHFIKDRDGKDLCTVRGILLQAHPEEVSINKGLEPAPRGSGAEE